MMMLRYLIIYDPHDNLLRSLSLHLDPTGTFFVIGRNQVLVMIFGFYIHALHAVEVYSHAPL